MSSTAELLPAHLAGAVAAGPGADEDADVAHTAPGVIVVAIVVAVVVVVVVAGIHPPTPRESPTMRMTITPSRFWPRRQSTTTTWFSALTRSVPPAELMETTRVPMTAFPTMTLATAPS